MAKRSRPVGAKWTMVCVDETGKISKKAWDSLPRPMTPAEARLVKAAIAWGDWWKGYEVGPVNERLAKAVAAVVKERSRK